MDKGCDRYVHYQKLNPQLSKSCLSLFTLILFFLLSTSHAFAAPTLRVNAEGKDVAMLQQKLLSLNYPIRDVQGKFAADTHYAVKKFQHDHQLKSNGVVDNATWKALDSALKGTGTSNLRPTQITPIPTLPNTTQRIEGSRKNAGAIIATAKNYIGVPYQFGGTTPKGFDCSGYLQFVFAQYQLKLPRAADEQYKIGQTVSQKNLQSGDLVFFTTYAPGASHCGIYIGNGQFIHASSSKGIRIDQLNDPYWKPRYLGAKCILN